MSKCVEMKTYSSRLIVKLWQYTVFLFFNVVLSFPEVRYVKNLRNHNIHNRMLNFFYTPIKNYEFVFYIRFHPNAWNNTKIRVENNFFQIIEILTTFNNIFHVYFYFSASRKDLATKIDKRELRERSRYAISSEEEWRSAEQVLLLVIIFDTY